MAAKEVNGKWYVVKKNGQLGKRAYKTKTNALNAQKTARANVKGGKKSKSKSKGGSKTTKKKETKKSNPNKLTHGKLNMGLAVGGPALRDFARGAYRTGDMVDTLKTQIAPHYAGYNLETNQIEADMLVPGYGGTVNEVIYKKLVQFIHSSPYPSKGSIVELLAYYGKPLIDAYENQDDQQQAIRLAYRDLYGVDLEMRGFGAYQPLEVIDTKGILQLIKFIKRSLRDQGVKLPKGV